jgi:hypothetical protein
MDLRAKVEVPNRFRGVEVGLCFHINLGVPPCRSSADAQASKKRLAKIWSRTTIKKD